MHYPSRDGEMERGSGHPVRPTFSCFKQKERSPPKTNTRGRAAMATVWCTIQQGVTELLVGWSTTGSVLPSFLLEVAHGMGGRECGKQS